MHLIPTLLAAAVLLPLVSFAMILVAGPKMGKQGSFAGYLATAAILGAAVLSFVSLSLWINGNPPVETAHHAESHDGQHDAAAGDHGDRHAGDEGSHDESEDHADGGGAGHSAEHDVDGTGTHAAEPITGDWYTLGVFGKLRLTIGYYIDALTVAMFCMVTLIATCIHIYALGYMHDELHDFTDPEVQVDGQPFTRPGRFPRFFQYMSLFCFSMLGLVVAGNVAMTFVFWELVGICSYFLIGFYIERHSASTAANKAFIVNRIGDFGMIIGLMALWASIGTFAFGDIEDAEGTLQPGIFSQVRPEASGYALIVPAGMVRVSALDEIDAVTSQLSQGSSPTAVQASVDAEVERLQGVTDGERGGPGYGLLIIAGLGIFCGCVGKSAQFPLHVWLPDAMEGPTPVSALVHSATMVAAGVFLVARFYPVFTPEVLLTIAVVGMITLFMAATIAITATDIKRVLAYSTVSQLGYMMLALGVGGWLAGVMHLITHAFFKSLLFLCSGSVIHGVHTNEMTEMGGLRKKMPWTAYTMLIGCLAIAGAGIPFVIGLSGYSSKDAILEQTLSFGHNNPGVGHIFFLAAAGGAAITAFYMFRLWYLTFAGKPRDPHRYDHAHESPPVMVVPLVLLAVFAIGIAWTPSEATLGAILAALIFLAVSVYRQWKRGEDVNVRTAWTDLLIPIVICGVVFVISILWQPLRHVTLANLLEQGRPLGTLEIGAARLNGMVWPNEHASHAAAIKVPATLIAFSTALAGILLATIFYCWRILKPEDVAQQFSRTYTFLRNKWWFDEIYDWVFVQPCLVFAKLIATIDQGVIDPFLNGLANGTRIFSNLWDAIVDRRIVDGTINWFADRTYDLGLALRRPQTGKLRQYVLFIAVGTIAIFVLASFFWGRTFAR
jgi:NADH-quinone oxidoreductase subunit L